MLKYLSVFSMIRRNPSPNDIAFGVCLALFLGFTPLNGSMALLLFLFFFIFKINRIAMLLMLPLFKIAYLAGIKSLCNAIGAALLAKSEVLTGFWAWFIGLPIIALLGINYTLVTGGFVLAALLSPAAFFITRITVIKLGASSANKLKDTKFGAWLMAGTPKSASVKTDKPSILRRMKLANIIVIIIALVIVQLGTALVISPLARAFIVDKLNESTGSRLMVGGLNVWPLTLSISLKDVKVFDNKRANIRIAKLDKASFAVSPIGLLSARIVISGAHLSGAEFTPEGVADSSFPMPKVTRPVPPAQAAAKSPWELASVLKTADRSKDLAGRVWQIVKSAFSKRAADNAKAMKRASKKVTKRIVKLDFGEKVEFTRGTGIRLLEVKSLGIDRAEIHLDGSTAVTNATIKIKELTYNSSTGADMLGLLIKGNIAQSGSSIGKAEFNFNKKVTGNKQSANLAAVIKDLDIASAKPLYDKSLPVYGKQGKLSFESRTTIEDSAMNSRNKIVLRGQNVVPRNQAEMIFKVIPASALCEAINGVDPLTLKFDIAGTVDKPEIKGLQDSLMALAKPYLEKVVKEKVMVEGKKLLSNLLDKNSGASETVTGTPSESTTAENSTADKALEAMGSFFKK